MKIEVKNPVKTKKSTISEMWVDGVFECHCLEDVVRKASEKKIFGATAIPAGTYHVIINMSNRFQKPLPLLLSVPGYEGVRIHPGNSDADTLGCLLPGDYDPKKPDWVSNSRDAFNKLFSKMQQATAIHIVITR